MRPHPSFQPNVCPCARVSEGTLATCPHGRVFVRFAIVTASRLPRFSSMLHCKSVSNGTHVDFIKRPALGRSQTSPASAHPTNLRRNPSWKSSRATARWKPHSANFSISPMLLRASLNRVQPPSKQRDQGYRGSPHKLKSSSDDLG